MTSEELQEVQKFNPYLLEVQEFIAANSSMVITRDNLNDADGILRQAKAVESNIETVRKQLKEPFLRISQAIDARAKELTNMIAPLASHIKNSILEIKRELEEERQAEIRRKAELEQMRQEEEARLERERLQALEAEKAANNVEDDFVAAIEAEIAKDEIQDAIAVREDNLAAINDTLEGFNIAKVSGIRKVWTFEIEDIMKVPIHYMQIDEKKIKAAIKDGIREIPGIKIFQDIQLSGR